MEKIGFNVILEFIKEIHKLLEKIEKNYGGLTNLNRNNINNKRTENYSRIIEELYNKYKTLLELELESGDGISNLLFKNDENDVIRIPESFLRSKNFNALKKGFDNYIYLTKLSNTNWNQFKYNLFKIFRSINEKEISYNINTLEKLRFFMTFINAYPEYNFVEFPENSIVRLRLRSGIQNHSIAQ